MMNSNTLYQEKDRSWLINVMLYLMCWLLALVILCYGIFSLKVYMQNQKIGEIDKKIAVYGTAQQKQYEQEVFDYKQKIDDFALIMNDHKMASNVFTFIEKNTLPGIWFLSITMSESRAEVRLSGESNDMATMGKQFQIFEENNNFIKNISVVDSQTAPSGKVSFVFNVLLAPDIFNYDAVFLKSTPPPAAVLPNQ